MSITIKGESGKTLNATTRSPESLLIDSWALNHESLADDTFIWKAKMESPTGTGTIVPEAGQIVEVYQDGVRRFRGHAAYPRYSLDSVTVQINGPFWWLNRVPISSPQEDGSGNTEDRTTFVFPTQSLRTSLISLLNRAIDLGVPMQLGTISTAYSVPKISLQNMTFAAALAELLRWMPDAVVWFDYTAGTPEINITRRDDMTELTLTVGGSNVESAQVYPRLDQEVKRVELNYVDRNPTTGRTRFQRQVNGSSTLGKTQIVPISGPELATFLPKDDFESVAVRTVVWNSISSSFVASRDAGLAAITASVGPVFGAIGSSFTRWTGLPESKTRIVTTVPGLRRASNTGASFPTNTRHLVVSPTPLPEWAQKKLNAMPVTITGTWIASWPESLRGVGVGWNSVYMAMQAGALTVNNGWENGERAGTSKSFRVDWLARPFTVSGYLIDTSYPTTTTLYKDWDYDYISPPTGLAEKLREAQDWVPWEGSVTQVADEADLRNRLARKIRLAGAYPGTETMDALIRSITKDSRGRTIYNLGSPARTDYGSLVNRIRREPADNIVYL